MKITTRDWTQLSAYLDNELSPRERRKFEARLAGQPGLQVALEDLRMAKKILASTPRLAVPRGFTLTPQMVELTRRRSPSQGYQLAAAALSFLFIAVVVVDIGSGVLRGAYPAALAPRSEEVTLKSAQEEDEVGAAADAVEEPAMLEAGEALEAEAPAEETAEMAQEVEAEQAAEPPSGGENLQEGVEGQAEAAAGEAPSEEDRAADSQLENAGEEEPEVQALPAATAGPAEEQYYAPPTEQAERPSFWTGISWLRIVEIVLGLAALAFAAAAWIKRRRMS